MPLDDHGAGRVDPGLAYDGAAEEGDTALLGLRQYGGGARRYRVEAGTVTELSGAA